MKAVDSHWVEEVISFSWDALPVTALEPKGVQDEGTFPTLL